MLKPQDIFALVGLQVLLRSGHQIVTLPQLAGFIRLSTSETHAAMSRLEQCQLLAATAVETRRPLEVNFLEFAEHGLRYVYPPELGPLTRGVATAAAVIEGLRTPGQTLVWPYEQGDATGPALAPLYRTVPIACLADRGLHVGMAALDSLRIGRPRERQAALAVLRKLFGVA